MTALENETRNALADFVERIEKLAEEKKAAGAAIKAEYEQAAAMGFDKKAIQQIVKERAADLDSTVEHRALVETYRQALGGMIGTPLGDWARDWAARSAGYQAPPSTPSAMDDFLKRRDRSSRSDNDGQEGRP